MWPLSSATDQNAANHVAEIPHESRLLEEPSNSLQTQPLDRPRADNINLEPTRWTGFQDERLGIPFVLRAPLLMGMSAFCGFALGAAKEGPVAADRYRAENAHRFPTSRSGWYLYHKTKNYHMFIGSIKEGFKYGTVLMGWATLFAVTEEMIDRSRTRLFARRVEDEERISGQRDAASTVMAALSVAGAYSWRSGFDRFAAARMAKMALRYSLAYGLLQDLTASLRGSRPAYIDWIIRNTTGSHLEINSSTREA